MSESPLPSGQEIEGPSPNVCHLISFEQYRHHAFTRLILARISVAVNSESSAMATQFQFPSRTDRSKFGIPIYKRSWTRQELISTFPKEKLRILDIGAGRYPFMPRSIDESVTLDFDKSCQPMVAVDFTREWPFGSEG